MPSRPNLPAFPEDVPTADLASVSLDGLFRGDPAELEKLSNASQTLGFFYLNLASHPEGRTLLNEAEGVFGVARQLSQLRPEEREQYRSTDNVWGYKGRPPGDKSGNRTFAFNSSIDDLLNRVPLRSLPPLMEKEDNRPYLNHSAAAAQKINLLLLSRLEEILGVSKGNLTSLHSNGEKGKETSSHLSITITPPATDVDARRAFYAHTDHGTTLGGLQVLVPNSMLGGGEGASWQYIKPREGHAIVNLGDVMGLLTNSYFRSNVHQVVDAPGEQAHHTRFSLVYFLYPVDNYSLPIESVAKFGKTKQTESELANKSTSTIPFKEFITRRLGYIDDELPQLHDKSHLPGVFGQRERALLAMAG